MSRATTQNSFPRAGTKAESTERHGAVRQWLLRAAADAGRAEQEWRDEGVALLRSGSMWGAVYIDGALVFAAAGTDDPPAVDRYLAAVLRGPVFANLSRRTYFVLTLTSTGRRAEWARPRDDAEYMGGGHYLSVPAPGRTDPSQRRYWCCEAARPGALVVADAVARLVQAGRDRLVTEQGD